MVRDCCDTDEPPADVLRALVGAGRHRRSAPNVQPMPETAPFGTWTSPITLELLVEQVVTLGFPIASGSEVYWTEARPSEAGRTVVVRAPDDGRGERRDVFGPEFYARTLAHEYGGLAYGVDAGTVYFSNFSDQRIYRVQGETAPEPITPEPRFARSVRYAAPAVAGGTSIFCVRETHSESGRAADVVNDIVVLPVDGSSLPRSLASGRDFYSHVTVSPDGRKIAFVAWDHPNMPWDGTELYELALELDGEHPSSLRLVAGGPEESVTQPKYSSSGELFFISDRTGWWNLYREDRRTSEVEPVSPMEADLGAPDWQFGNSSYALLTDGSVIATWSDRGLGRLGCLAKGTDHFVELETEFTTFAQLRATPLGDEAVALAGAASQPTSVVRIRPHGTGGVTAPVTEVLRESRGVSVDARYLSVPRPIEFPTEGGLTAHALYYPPQNPDFVAPEGELPPVIVQSHGGPTGAATSVLNYGIQFWTSRGFAIVDVDYGGSVGYGREYRERIRSNWGVVDLDDCVNAARFLVETGRADPRRLLIHGGSAGGYTTLCAATFREVFAAGASYFGVADVGALARDTHKFESRYLDKMIGPWPEAEDIYRARSPLFHAEKITTPLILFQGLEDKVVPPAQAETMVASLRERKVPFSYVAYEGESHGFRKAENIMRTTEAELYFYGRVLGFTPADDLHPVEIENDERLSA